MIDVQILSIKEKVSLLNKLYKDISGLGIGGDTELAHINPWEAALLRAVGGSGTLNGVTGLPQYMGGGGSSTPPAPAVTTTKQVPEYAPEQREYIRDIFGKTQKLYEQRTAEGFQPFPGQQLAGWDPRETEAFTGMANLARGPGAGPAYEIARQASLDAASPITADEIQQGMNPYQQAVTDIGKREAVRDYQRGPQARIRTDAVAEGGLRGARRFIEEGEGQRNLNQQLSDMQVMGSNQAYKQAVAEAAASRGRLANLATQMPTIGTGAYNQQMGQLGQLGGVGEAYRGREQAGIDLAQQQFQQEQMFPEETLATYLRFITNAPQPSGFQQTVTAPGVRGPSALTQTAGLLGGLGSLAGGLGGTRGFLNQGGRVEAQTGSGPTGRRAGLSGVVHRAHGGQIVRMQQGGSARNYSGAPGLVLPIEDVPFTPLQQDAQRIADAVAKFMPDTSSNIATRQNRAINESDIRSAYFTGTPKELEDARARTAETERMIEAARAAGMGLDKYIQNYENSGFAPSAPTKETTTTLEKLKAAPSVEQETVVTGQPTPERSQETLVDQFKKLMEVPEAEMSWAERLQLASTLMNAGNKGSTGSFLGDLSQFGADTAGGVGKALSSRDARALAAQKRKITTLKDFNQFVKDAKLTPLEIKKLRADINLTEAETNELTRKNNNPEVASPGEVDIAGAISYLDRMGVSVLETSKEKGQYGNAGTAYQLAQVQKSLNTSADNAFRIAKERGATSKDADGRLIIDVVEAIRGGPRRADQPTQEYERGADGRLVAKAEGGRITLRYPEDF
jgi:hypothetical protein